MDVIHNSTSVPFAVQNDAYKRRRIVSNVRLEGSDRKVLLNALYQLHGAAAVLTRLFNQFHGHPPHHQYNCALNEADNLLAGLEVAVVICLVDELHHRKCLFVFPPTNNELVWHYDRRVRQGAYLVRGIDAATGDEQFDGDHFVIDLYRLYTALSTL